MDAGLREFDVFQKLYGDHYGVDWKIVPAYHSGLPNPHTRPEYQRAELKRAGFYVVGLLLLLLARPAWALDSKGLDNLVPVIIAAESSGDPKAVGDHGRARGLMQIQEATWKSMTKSPWSEAFNEEANVQVGRHILETINEAYRDRGIDADRKHIVYTYNTGKYEWGALPPWTKKHPNRIYRRVFNEKSLS